MSSPSANRDGRMAGVRTIVVLQSPFVGGPERQAILLARELRDVEGADVRIWGFAGPGPVSAHCEALGLPWRHVASPTTTGSPLWPATFLRFARELRRARPDLLLPYIAHPNISCGLTWRLTGARLCVWNQRDEGLDIATGRLARIAARLTPLFIANSEAGRDLLLGQLRVAADRIHIIRNGIVVPEPSDASAAWRERLGVPPDGLLACMVANLTGKKDHATLVRAWAQVVQALAAEGRAAKLVLAGAPGGTKEAIDSLARELGIAAAVELVGAIPDLPALLGAMDLATFSSVSEGCPNGVLECMAHSLAVAGTDIPGIQLAVSEPNRKLLAPKRDADALAACILQLARSAALRRAVGEANLTRVKTVFSVDRLRSETAALLARH